MPWSDRIGEFVLFALAALFAWLGADLLDAVPVGYEPGPRDPSSLRVVTWNVGGAGGQEGQPMADEWLSAVAETLNRLDPDLVFLQEVRGPTQLAAILRQLGGGWRGTTAPGGNRRVAVLLQRGSLRAYSISTATRRSAMAVVYRSEHHPPLAAVALHADAFSARRRNRQIGRAVDALLAMHGAEAKILAGDLNLDLDLDKRRDLFSDNEHRDVESYNYIVGSLFDAGVGRGSTADPDRRLDYIFVNKELGVIGAGPWKGRRVGAMDHDPVIADLRFVPR